MKKTSAKTSSAEKKPATARRRPASAASDKPAPAKKSTARKTPSAVKRATPAQRSASAPETVIVARVDAGFGNHLFIRGDAPGLSWERGTPLSCTDFDCWTWRSSSPTAPFEFKILLNDEHWSQGENWSASPGETREIAPEF